jgi:hypothetical protein
MARVRLLQCSPEQAELLQAAGHQLTDDKLCDAVVIGLARRPSCGRELAVALRSAKSTRHIPILFVDGVPERVEAIRQLLPDAIYTNSPRLPAALKKVKPLANPVVPTPMMDRYASRTTAQKLGIHENSKVTVVDPPRDYLHVLGDLPANVEIEEDPEKLSAVTVCFLHQIESLPDILGLGLRIAARSKFWICWKKGQKTGLNDIPIRNAAVALGLVDYKVCSLNPTWSGMLFAVKKAA